MFSVMQDPGVAHRLTQQYTEDRAQAAARYRLARSTRPAGETTTTPKVESRTRHGWRVRVLRPSFR
jgi:hypothetical protein